MHVLPRKDGWAVVREGNERATSVHRTQAEAAEVGREVARKDRTAFLLHAKDGHVRDRSDYGGGPSPPKERPEGAVAGVASAATRATGAAVGLASGVVEGAVEGLGRAETGSMPAEGHAEDRADDTPGEGSDASKEEVGRLAYEERHADYEAYDQLGKHFATVDTLFLDEEEELEYVGVKKDRSGTESALIIPTEVVTVDDERGRMVVARSNNVVEQGPTLADEEAATPEFEERVRIHYGLDSAARSGTYGEYHEGPPEESVGAGTSGGEGSSASGRGQGSQGGGRRYRSCRGGRAQGRGRRRGRHRVPRRLGGSPIRAAASGRLSARGRAGARRSGLLHAPIGGQPRYARIRPQP